MSKQHSEYAPDAPAIQYMDALPKKVKRMIAERTDHLRSVDEVIQYAQKVLHGED